VFLVTGRAMPQKLSKASGFSDHWTLYLTPEEVTELAYIQRERDEAIQWAREQTRTLYDRANKRRQDPRYVKFS
jgi:hypothetical protein